jgi:hypothetical protein
VLRLIGAGGVAFIAEGGGATSLGRVTGAPLVKAGSSAAEPRSRTRAAVAAAAVSLLFPATSASLTRMLSWATSAGLFDFAQAAPANTRAIAPSRTACRNIPELSFIGVLSHEADAVPHESQFVIRTFSDETEAYIAQAALEANGIESSLIRDDAGGMMPWLQWLHPIRLVVAEGDTAEALHILDTPPAPEKNVNP